MWVKTAIILDDGLVIENDYRGCKTLSSRIREDLRRIVFVANAKKSTWEPVQSIVWLGFCWNSLNGTISITERRLNKIFDHIQNITNNYYVLSARQLASFTGKIISTGPVVGNVSRFMTRHCSMSVAAAPDWDSLFTLHQYCINEVGFSKDNIQKDSRVKTFTDNRAAAKIVEVGSMRYDLQCFALRIFQMCLAYRISLDIQSVPRSEVAKADFISRFFDVDDWQISRPLFFQLERLWGPHTVDCFAILTISFLL